MRISTKLIGGFLAVAAICAIVGTVGYRGMSSLSESLNVLGTEKVQALKLVEEINSEQLTVAKSAAQLLQEGLPLERRQELYESIRHGFVRADRAVEVFSTIPKSSMEQMAWDSFGPSWESWKGSVEGFLTMCDELDGFGIAAPTAFEADLAKLLSKHEDWVIKLSEAIVTQTNFTGELDPTKCELGGFLSSFHTDNGKLADIFKLISLQHEKLHKGAAFINKLIDRKGTVSNDVMRERLELAYVSRILSPLSNMRGLFRKASDVAQQSVKKYEDMARFYGEEMLHGQQAVVSVMDDVIAVTDGEVNSAAKNGMAMAKKSARTAVVSVAIGVVLALGLGFLLSRSITGPIASVVRFAEKGRDGDLTLEESDFQVGSGGEMARMAGALAEMVSKQRDVVRRILRQAGEFSDGSGTLAALAEEMNASMAEVQSAVDKVAQLAENGAAALQQTSAGVEEIAAGAERTAKFSKETADAAEEGRRSTDEAASEMGNTIDEVHGLGEFTVKTKDNISDLAKSVDAIAGFVTTITTIADQTNLLALNAAIEAARAGEAGRGFAVVAEEVRKLAEESAGAAQEVSKLIDELTDKARQSVSVAGKTEKMVEDVIEKAENSRDKLRTVLNQVDRITEGVEEMAKVAENQSASSQEMASAIESVSRTVMEVSEMMETVRTATDETARAADGVSQEAQTMSGRADDLVSLVKVFKVDRQDRASGLEPFEG